MCFLRIADRCIFSYYKEKCKILTNVSFFTKIGYLRSDIFFNIFLVRICICVRNNNKKFLLRKGSVVQIDSIYFLSGFSSLGACLIFSPN